MNKEKKAKYMKEYRQRPDVIEKQTANRKQYYENNKIYILNQQKDKKDKINARRRERYKLNLNDCVDNNKTRQRTYYLKNKKFISKKNAMYYLENLSSIKKIQKKYNSENKDKRNAKHAERWETDTLYKLKILMRGRIWKIINRKRLDKNCSTRKIIGCTYNELKKHIEKQFTKGMSWDLMGEIHLDHIVPLASAKTEQELYKLCNYKNLQPLWAIDNLKKGDRILY